MDLGLVGKPVFVSGSTQGIGFAVAAGCLAEGARVVVHGRHDLRVTGAVERLRAAAPEGDVSGTAADVVDPGQVETLLGARGDVDVLVKKSGSSTSHRSTRSRTRTGSDTSRSTR